MVRTEITVNKVPKVSGWPMPLRKAMLGLVLEGCESPEGFAVDQVTLQSALLKKSREMTGLFIRTIPFHVNHLLFKESGEIIVVR